MKTLDNYELTLSLICYMLRGYLLRLVRRLVKLNFVGVSDKFIIEFGWKVLTSVTAIPTMGTASNRGKVRSKRIGLRTFKYNILE
jgi:hypothetical protein